MLLSHRPRAIGNAAWVIPRRNIIGCTTYTLSSYNRQHRHTGLKHHSTTSPARKPKISSSIQPYNGIISIDSIMTIPPRPSPSASSPTIKTRILIISDTHATVPRTKEDNPADTEDELNKPGGPIAYPTGFRSPLPEADVVLHCGDLSKRGRPDEMRKTFDMLRGLRAPLKLVIAGNHDLAFDDTHYYHDNSDGSDDDAAKPNPKPRYKEVLQIAKEAEVDGVKYLTEGTYSFDLANGSRLRIYASQYTPQYGYWAFQYQGGEHNFDIPSDVDIAMTHGPPLGILDRTSGGDRAGCGSLFRSLHRARPKIHCFGHIHEDWGAELMQWRDEPIDTPQSSWMPKLLQSKPIISSATVLDRENSRTLYTLTPPPMSIATNTTLIDMDEHKRLLEWSKDRGCYIDLADGENKIKEGEQTLFVNASIMSVRYRPSQMPLVVDMDLPRATDSNP
ncbi:Metallo-dependent phosphatase-like protein [Trichoderma evansii]